MLIRKLYVPNTCFPGRNFTIYIIWEPDRNIEIRILKPSLLYISKIFNTNKKTEINSDELVFSRFIINGYLGISFNTKRTGNLPTSASIKFIIEDESGLSEIYERKIVFPGNSETETDYLPKICVYRDSMESQQISSIQDFLDILREDTQINNLDEKNAASTVLEQIYRTADLISRDLQNEFQVVGQELTILSSQHKIISKQMVIPKKKYPLPKTIKFTHIIPSKIEVTRIPDLKHITESIVYTADGYKLKLNFLLEGTYYLLSLENKFEGSNSLSHLVECCCLSKNPEVVKDGIMNCEICVQLKYPDILIHGECSLNIYDLEIEINLIFGANYIDNIDIKTKTFNPISILQIISKNIQNSDYHKYIDVTGDFSFSAMKITHLESFESADLSQPIVLKIIVHTDLSPTKPAADGELFIRLRNLFNKNVLPF